MLENGPSQDSSDNKTLILQTIIGLERFFQKIYLEYWHYEKGYWAENEYYTLRHEVDLKKKVTATLAVKERTAFRTP